jgi:hypothetical protein
MARLPKVKLRAIPVFPSTVTGSTGIAVTKANGIFTVTLDVSDLNIANVPTDETNTTYAISFGGVTTDNPNGVYSLTPFAGFQGVSADLTSLAELDTLGMVSRIGDADFATRTITAGTGIGVTNGSGISGNPVVAITDAELLALAGVTSAADRLFYFTGSGTGSLATFTTFGRSLVDDPDAATARATLGVVIGTNVQAWDADLDAVAALSTTGLVARTGAGTSATRTITAPAAGITLSNGDGVAGNPTLALANDLAALEALSGTNTIYYRSGVDTWSAVTIGGLLSFSAGTLNITDAELAAIGGLVSAADRLPYFTGSGTASLATFTTFGRSLVDDPDAATAQATLGLVIGTNVQAFDSDLSALASNATNGLWARTGSGTGSARTLTAPAAGITVSNGDGVAGNPALALANDLSALEGLASTGIAVRTASDTWAQRTLQAPAAGLTISNPAGVAGDPAFALANDLSALEGLSGTGIARRTGTDTWSAGTTVSPTEGGTGVITYTLGDVLYSSAANTLAALAGNTTTTRKFLRQTGNGSASAAPAWDTLLAADVPTLNQSTTGSAATLTTPRAIDGQNFDGSAPITVIAPGTHAATSKATPVDADELPLVDSAASNVLKKLTWANLKATAKTYFDTLYQPTGVGTSVAFTPTWKGGTTDPTLGNGSLSGRYIRTNNDLFVAIDLVIGSTTTMGTGYWYFVLPLGLTAALEALGGARALDAGVAEYYGWTQVPGGSNQIVGKINAGTVSGTYPFTFGTGDELHLSANVFV